MKPIKAEFFLLLVTFIWGGTFVFTKIGLDYCPPSFYIILRFLIALSLSVLFFHKYLLGMKRDVVFQGLTLGVLFGGGFLLQTYGLGLTSVSKSAFITGITVPITPIAFYLILRKPIGIYSIYGVFIATIGLWIFTNPDFDNINIGDVLTLVSTMFWALYITYIDVFTSKRTDRRETAQLVVLQFLGATPLAIIFFFLLDFENFYFTLSNQLIISLLFNGVMASFLVTLIHTSIQRYTTPVKAALIFSLEPIVASTIAVILFHEHFGLQELIGASLLLSAVLISEIGGYYKHRKKSEIIT